MRILKTWLSAALLGSVLLTGCGRENGGEAQREQERYPETAPKETPPPAEQPEQQQPPPPQQ